MHIEIYAIILLNVIFVCGDTSLHCCKEPIKSIGSCCVFPTLINPVWIKECSVILSKPVNVTKSPKPASKKVIHSGSIDLNDDTPTPKRARRQALTQSSHCLLDCVFKKRKFYDSKGMLNSATMAANVASFVDDDWSNIVAVAMSDCVGITEEAVLTNTPLAHAGVQNCNYKAEFYMNCVNRNMILSCPKEAQTNADEKSCPVKIKKVSDCDPMMADTCTLKSEVDISAVGEQYLPSLNERVLKDRDVKPMYGNQDGYDFDYNPFMKRPSRKTGLTKILSNKSASKPAHKKKDKNNNFKKPVLAGYDQK